MVIFFSIFVVMIAVNAFLLLASTRKNNARTAKGNGPEASRTVKIYPLDLQPSEYKKAI